VCHTGDGSGKLGGLQPCAGGKPSWADPHRRAIAKAVVWLRFITEHPAGKHAAAAAEGISAPNLLHALDGLFAEMVVVIFNGFLPADSRPHAFLGLHQGLGDGERHDAVVSH